jgi:hypothetical protein
MLKSRARCANSKHQNVAPLKNPARQSNQIAGDLFLTYRKNLARPLAHRSAD